MRSLLDQRSSQTSRPLKKKKSSHRATKPRGQRKNYRNMDFTTPTPVVNCSTIPPKVLISGMLSCIASGPELFAGKEGLESLSFGVTLFLVGVVLTQMGWGWRILDGIISDISHRTQGSNQTAHQVSEVLDPILSLLFLPQSPKDREKYSKGGKFHGTE